MFLPVGVHGCTEPYPGHNTCAHSLCTHACPTLSWLTCLDHCLFTPMAIPVHSVIHPTPSSLLRAIVLCSILQANFSVGIKEHTITSNVVRLHCPHMTSYYWQRPLETARQISARNDKDASLAGLGGLKLNDLLRSISTVLWKERQLMGSY